MFLQRVFPAYSRFTVAKKPAKIPVIDIFAGPGGLGEGFSAFSPAEEHFPFDVTLSIEKDPVAHQTLLLRKFYRAFPTPPPEYSKYLAKPHLLTRQDLFSQYPTQASEAAERAWLTELGKTNRTILNARIRAGIGNQRKWILVGGPPCQAYSLVGRSRMRTTRPDFEGDERHFLYREYLQVVAEHQPPVFLMENVKGLLSATHGGARIFSRILGDLQYPGRALDISKRKNLRYRLYSLVEKSQRDLFSSKDVLPEPGTLVVRSEKYGIPQARHRVFVLGVRDDITTTPNQLQQEEPPTVADVIGDLPRLRSTVSRGADSIDQWHAAIRSLSGQEWIRHPETPAQRSTANRIRTALKEMEDSDLESGAHWLPYRSSLKRLKPWYRQDASGITCHEARGHMASDLRRYFFAATFAQANDDRPPTLRDFPDELLPAHENAAEGQTGAMFSDRFRVQVATHPSTTITSHISKDGHYFIHYDPSQCRSLTVREAARLQTFPDSYFFEGPRTEQYRQVGNAVPPLLASKIAAVIYDLLQRGVRG